MTVRGKFNINSLTLLNIRYVDDTVIISEDKEVLQSLLTRLKEESERGLNINKKTKIVILVRNQTTQNVS